MEINKLFKHSAYAVLLAMSLQGCLFEKKDTDDDDDSGDFSCLVESEELTSCINYKSGFSKSEAEDSCEEESAGVFQEEACSEDDLVGTCEVASSEPEAEFDMLFYTVGTVGYDAETAEAVCTLIAESGLEAEFHPEDGR